MSTRLETMELLGSATESARADMLGGALLVSYFGAGPLSFDSRRERSSR